MTKKPHYPLERSPFFQLSSKRKLAELLGTTVLRIEEIIRDEVPSNNYNIFVDNKTTRLITEPSGDLARIHKKILNLFTRIEADDFLHSARKKHSYKTNAEQHLQAENILKIDIKKFYPSIKFSHIHDFFRNVLNCSPDVAVILSKICSVKTDNGPPYLPTGSCISPLLSYYINIKLFRRVAVYCKSRGCEFTLYIDDMTISGTNANKALLNEVAKFIHQAGFGYHKIKLFNSVPAEITGLIIKNSKIYLPHARARKIRDLHQAFVLSRGSHKRRLMSSLIGCLSEAEQIMPVYTKMRRGLMSKFSNEWQLITDDRLAKSRSARRRLT
jgi:RNA-directed DNA polymerase